MSGTITRVGISTPGTRLGSTWIDAPSFKARCKLFYASCDRPQGSFAVAGQHHGVVQDVATHYHKTSPRDGEMTNHVHLTLEINGKVVDPTPYFEDIR